ncbi:MAG TPA: ion transporter [Gemmatimonadales bacterium]|nr:ion transporter [Gemmatimonadales bacterium]
MVQWCRRLADNRVFQNGVLLVIVLAAVVAGMETSEPLSTRYGSAFSFANATIQAIFVAELTIRLVAFWPRVPRFFVDGWNTFDFLIVTASLLPSSGAYATVGRLARLLRAGRLFSRVPELRLIIGTMLRSIRSMGHVLMLLGVLLYIYAVLGFHLFSEVAPERWGDLSSSVLTLIGVLTLEGWVDVQGEVISALPFAWIYFLSFIVMAVFIGLNLFIAIVVNNLEATKREVVAQARSDDRARLIAEIAERLEKLG